MKIHPATQGSEEWLKARAGIPTASEFHKLLTPKFEIRKGEMVATYLAQKLAEKWSGGPLFSGGGFAPFAAEQGQILEGTAIPWYEFEYGVTIQRVGLITSDDGRVGCSPDGLIGEDNGIEIKCPEATQHVKYLLGGTVPDDYICQVLGAMFVTGRPKWTFVSFRKGYPPLRVEMEHDPKFEDRLAEALALFLAKFDAGLKKMLELNNV